ncbi:MAG: mechanosensitive ion channel family protein [Ammonifex sp.]|jgi:small-conductance mechanosensitive channel|nr:MAG: mechanosensitive ion channel family protein [Ammonifex sp.]
MVIAGYVAGYILEKVILAAILRLARNSKWQGDEIIAGGFRGIVLLWGVLCGVYGAILTVSLTPAVHNLLLKILQITIILSVTFVLMRVAVGFINYYAEKAKGVLPSTTLFVNVTKLIILIIGLLVALQTIGISITPILTALGVGGLAVALALQDTLANLFSGIHIIISKQIRPGDYIKLETGQEGFVTDINWRNTTIRALANNTFVIPNTKMASSIVTNYSFPEEEMAVLSQVGVDYASDLDRVERVTIDVARQVMKEVPGGVPEFEPLVRYHTFADSSIDFTVILRVKEFVYQYPVKHEFVKRLHKRYAEEGIKIPFPIRTVYMRGPEPGDAGGGS